LNGLHELIGFVGGIGMYFEPFLVYVVLSRSLAALSSPEFDSRFAVRLDSWLGPSSLIGDRMDYCSTFLHTCWKGGYIIFAIFFFVDLQVVIMLWCMNHMLQF
jgi:hypothetical protein